MNFIKRSNLEGKHALLSASKYHWINYDEERLQEFYRNQRAAERGTLLHNYAMQSILLGQKLPRSKKTLNMYVNDAIGFAMTPEQVLYYSDNVFGTTDAISFRGNTLRIHDYKSGYIPAHMEQLRIYMALFCLDYQQDPNKISSELRIYHNDDVMIENPDPQEIEYIMNKIRVFDGIINRLKVEEG